MELNTVSPTVSPVDKNLLEKIIILESVKTHFRKNGGSLGNIAMAKKAIKKASLGFYGICNVCSHIATAEEINRSPFFCSKCKNTFV